MLVDQARTIKELEFVIRGYEDNLGEPLRAVREDVEKEWKSKVDAERKARDEKEEWANELVRQLDREKQVCFSLTF
jgi:centromeric protein E